MNKLLSFYRLLNILSIDVALGAVCCGAWFAKYFDVQLRPYALICLGLTVWLIYTADHLLDARKINGEASSVRHRFHQAYFKVLCGLLLLGGMIDFVLLFFIRAQVLYTGMLLIGIVAVYLLLNRWLGYIKEIAVASLYCGGVMLPSLSLKTSDLNGPDAIIIMLCFFATALINIMMFSWFDHEADMRDGYNSFSVKFNKGFTQKFIAGLFVLQAIFFLLLFFNGDFTVLIMLASMNSVLFLIFVRSGRFSEAEYYRLAGDAVFLIPTVFLVI